MVKQRIKHLSVYLIGAVTAVSVFSGCASDNHDPDMADLHKQLYELQKAQGLQASKLEELNNKILLLKDRVDKATGNFSQTTDVAPPPMETPAQKIVQTQQPVPVGSPAVKAVRDESQNDGEEAGNSDDNAGSKQAPTDEPSVELRPAHGAMQSQKNSAGADGLYNEAVNDAKQGRMSALEKDVDHLLKSYKESPLTNNAIFLLADTLFDRGDFKKSAIQYERLYKLFPDGNKAVAALYRLGLCYRKMGRNSEAKEALQNVITVYPGSREALEAQKILAEDGSGGT